MKSMSSNMDFNHVFFILMYQKQNCFWFFLHSLEVGVRHFQDFMILFINSKTYKTTKNQRKKVK